MDNHCKCIAFPLGICAVQREYDAALAISPGFQTPSFLWCRKNVKLLKNIDHHVVPLLGNCRRIDWRWPKMVDFWSGPKDSGYFSPGTLFHLSLLHSSWGAREHLVKEIGFGLAKAGVSRLTLFGVAAVTKQWNYSGINKQSLYGTADFTPTWSHAVRVSGHRNYAVGLGMQHSEASTTSNPMFLHLRKDFRFSQGHFC